jgi:hypothetical protein
MSKIWKLGAVVGLGFVAAVPAITQMPEKEAKAGDKPNIEGNYTIAGKGDDGTSYTGTGTISLIGGMMYNAKWNIGDNTFKGVCFRDDDDLSCGWAIKDKDANVVAYLVKDDGLDGVWFESGGTKLGNEYLTPNGKVKKNLNGKYSISKGKNPDGSAYSGSAVVTNLSDVGDAVYQFDWVIGSAKIRGVGVRNVDAGEDDVLSVGFADTGKEYGALQYDISNNGKSLVGHWVQSINGTVSDGKETMTKAK